MLSPASPEDSSITGLRRANTNKPVIESRQNIVHNIQLAAPRVQPALTSLSQVKMTNCTRSSSDQLLVFNIYSESKEEKLHSVTVGSECFLSDASSLQQSQTPS